MGRTPSPIVAHRLSAAEQRVLSSFLAGRLPAGQLHSELQRVRATAAAAPAPPAALAVQPVPAVAA